MRDVLTKFSLFNLQASYRPCLLLEVKVLRGHHITLGSFDDLRKYSSAFGHAGLGVAQGAGMAQW